ncbi:MAG TPA: hypothetical protein ENN34_02210 [Deltaproteobacteria bacterium]|nr:hypothetical protein [Deltaproteobacteria bacterium]
MSRMFTSEHFSEGSAVMGDTQEVRTLIARRDKFIAEHPHLKSTQEEIDRLMGTTLDPVMRLEILFMLISGKLQDMRTLFTELMKLAKDAMPEESGHM